MNVLSTKVIECQVEGSGEKQAEALEAAFQQLRVEVAKKVQGSIISMNAIEVELLNKAEKSRKERFLYLLFPREIKTLVLKLNIKVEVRYINLEEGLS
jgi:uncharacterized protein (TIGR03578 family)